MDELKLGSLTVHQIDSKGIILMNIDYDYYLADKSLDINETEKLINFLQTNLNNYKYVNNKN